VAASHSPEVSQNRKSMSQIGEGSPSGLWVALILISHLSSYHHDQSTRDANKENGRSKRNPAKSLASEYAAYWKDNTLPFVRS